MACFRPIASVYYGPRSFARIHVTYYRKRVLKCHRWDVRVKIENVSLIKFKPPPSSISWSVIDLGDFCGQKNFAKETSVNKFNSAMCSGKPGILFTFERLRTRSQSLQSARIHLNYLFLHLHKPLKLTARRISPKSAHSRHLTNLLFIFK